MPYGQIEYTPKVSVTDEKPRTELNALGRIALCVAIFPFNSSQLTWGFDGIARLRY